MSELIPEPTPKIPENWEIPAVYGIEKLVKIVQVVPESGFLAVIRNIPTMGNVMRYQGECVFAPNGKIKGLKINHEATYPTRGWVDMGKEVTLHADNFYVNYELHHLVGLGDYAKSLEVKFSNIGKRGFRISESGNVNTGEDIVHAYYQSSSSDNAVMQRVTFSGDLQAGGEDVRFGPPAHLYFDSDGNSDPRTEQEMIKDGWKKGGAPNEYLYIKNKERLKVNYNADAENRRIIAEYEDLQSGRKNRLEIPLRVNLAEVEGILDHKAPYETKERFGAKALDIPWLGIRDVVGVSFSPPTPKPL